MMVLGRSALSETPLRRHVICDMAVEKPIPSALRPPGHSHRRARTAQRRADASASGGGESGGGQGVNGGVGREVEPMEVHRVLLRAQIDDTPANILLDGIAESL